MGGTVVRSWRLFAAAGLWLVLAAPLPAPAANLLWTEIYPGPAGGAAQGKAVAIAGDGSVYVTGFAAKAGEHGDLLLAKYSAAGSLLWAKSYNGFANDEDWGAGVAVAPDGSVYVAGTTYTAGRSFDLLLFKYSSSGTLLWDEFYDGGSANGGDVGNAVAVAGDGSVYVAGSTYVPGQSFNLLLLKYSSSGTLLENKTYAGAGENEDSGNAIAVGTDGSVSVAGHTYVAGRSSDLLLLKYSASGSLRWKKTVNGGANGADTGQGVAFGGSGKVHVAGYTAVAGQSYNALVRKYAGDGSLAWKKTFNGAANGNDLGYGVAADKNGNIYVTGGSVVTGGGYDLFLHKYSAAGALLWKKSYAGAGLSGEMGRGVAVARDGSVYVVGHTPAGLLLLKYR